MSSANHDEAKSDFANPDNFVANQKGTNLLHRRMDLQAVVTDFHTMVTITTYLDTCSF
jgi:hypothetical protein